MSKPRAYNKEEVRNMFLETLRANVEYWNSVEEKSCKLKLEGLAFSILNIFDGTSGNFPAIDLVLSPHDEDKEYCIDQGENWFEDGVILNNDVMLHEFFYQKTEQTTSASQAEEKRILGIFINALQKNINGFRTQIEAILK